MVFWEGDAPPPAWVLTGSKLARAASGRPFVPASEMDGWDGFGVWTPARGVRGFEFFDR